MLCNTTICLRSYTSSSFAMYFDPMFDIVHLFPSYSSVIHDFGPMLCSYCYVETSLSEVSTYGGDYPDNCESAQRNI